MFYTYNSSPAVLIISYKFGFMNIREILPDTVISSNNQS